MRKIVNLWKVANQDKVAVAGSPAAADPYQILEKADYDLVVIGEREATLEELLTTTLSEGQMPDQDTLGVSRGWLSGLLAVLN